MLEQDAWKKERENEKGIATMIIVAVMKYEEQVYKYEVYFTGR